MHRLWTRQAQMTVAEILALLPEEFEVVLQPIGGTATYADTAGAWLADDGKLHRLEDFVIVTEIHLPDQPDPNGPVDLTKLMSGEPPEEDWMVEPILPKGKLVGIVSKRGDGKSLVTLDIAAKRAAGLPILGHGHDKPVHVVYLDLEMGPEDLFDRLFSLGWTVDHPQFPVMVEHLHYYQLITIPPLDTQEGGEAIEALVELHKATLVVIDTVSRVISGEENTAEPFRDLFRHTETRLKRRGVTLARLDHLGKDADKGSRGSSAKEDPLDVVWHLTQSADDLIHLKLTKGRQDWVPRQVAIRRVYDNGKLSHELPVEFAPEYLTHLVGIIDELGVPDDASANQTQQALIDAGNGQRRKAILEAVRFRRGRFKVVPEVVPAREPPPGNQYGNQAEPPSENVFDLGEDPGTTPGTSGNPDKGEVPPLRGGTTHPLDLPDPFN